MGTFGNRQQVVVEVVVDPTKARRGRVAAEAELSAFQRNVQTQGKRLDKSVTALSTLGKGFAGAAAAQIAVSAFRDLASAGSDLNEEVNKSSVVFGTSAAAILDWSKTTAGAIGISRTEALRATGVFGNMLRPLGIATDQAAGMSRRLVELAADLASFNNADPTEVLDALRSGLAGETEPLRRYGIQLSDLRLKQEALTEGLVDAGFRGTLDAQTKALAAYGLILKDTKLAQGDFSRTSEGLANKQRILNAKVADLKAQLGTALLPVMSETVDLLLKATTAAEKLATALGTIAAIEIPAIHIPFLPDFPGGRVGDFMRKALGIGLKVQFPVVAVANELGLFDSPKGSPDVAGQAAAFDSQFGLAGFLDRNAPKPKGSGRPPAFGEPGFKPLKSPDRQTEIAARFRESIIDAQMTKGVEDDLKALGAARAELERLLGQSGLTSQDRVTLKTDLASIISSIDSIHQNIADDAAETARTLKENAQKLADSIKSNALDRLNAQQSNRDTLRGLADARDALRIAQQEGGAKGIKAATRNLEDAVNARQRALIEGASFTPAGSTVTVRVGNIVLPGVRNAKQLLAEINKLSRGSAPQSRGRAPGRTAGGV